MELFKIFGTIGINNSDANRALDETVDKGQKTQGKLSKIFSGIGKGAAVVGKTIGVGLATGATAMVGLTTKAMQSAGALEQQMGGSQAVFGEYADKMQEKAKSAYSSMGLSTNDYLQTANKMGSLFKGAGFETSEAMDLTSKAMQRASDVASIMGIDTASAMESIAGAAKGNFTMMDNLGVAMNDTTLNAYAMSKGITKSTQEMTNQEKIGLAMEMFLEKTADYAGNYAKENETLAGSLGTAKAAFQNFLDGSGDVDSVVNSFSGAINSMVRQLDSLLPRLVSGLTDMGNKLIPMFPPLFQKVLPVIVEGAISLINGIVGVLPQVVDAIVGALPLILDGVMQIFSGIVSALPQLMQTIISALPQLIQTIVGALPTLIPQLIDGIVSVIVLLCENFASIIQPIINALPDIIISIVDAIMRNLPILIDGFISLILGIVDALPQIIEALIDALPRVIEMIVTGLFAAREGLINGAIKLVGALVGALPRILVSLTKALPKAFLGIWNGVKNIFKQAPEWFAGRFNAAVEAIGRVFKGVKDALVKPFNSARDAIKKVADKIKGFFKGEFKMPKIKLPKFSIKPAGWKLRDLLEGSIPKLGITWAAKGGIFDEPTLFNTPTGTLGVGEAGAEAVAPIDVLMGYVQSAVQAETNGISELLERIIELLTMFFPQILEEAGRDIVLDDRTLVSRLAPKINIMLKDIRTRNERGG